MKTPRITHRTVTREVIVPMCADIIADTRTSVTFSIKAAKTKEIINPIDLRNLMDNDFANAGDVCGTKRSMEDQKFLNTLEAGVTRTADGHFEMPLPFRDKDRMLPNNRCVAEKRLEGLKKRLLKD